VHLINTHAHNRLQIEQQAKMVKLQDLKKRLYDCTTYDFAPCIEQIAKANNDLTSFGTAFKTLNYTIITEKYDIYSAKKIEYDALTQTINQLLVQKNAYLTHKEAQSQAIIRLEEERKKYDTYISLQSIYRQDIDKLDMQRA
jgi:hypothetical protein